MDYNNVILVDDNDNFIGTEEKMKAHVSGKLHRAFSIFLFNSDNQMLLHQRAYSKYHSGGLWTNTCCSHPQPKSTIKKDISDRLLFEMGVECELNWLFSFKYKAGFDNGITEHEYDHVYTGIFNGIPDPNPDEVADWSWLDLSELETDIRINPKKYTEWFKKALPMVQKNFFEKTEKQYS